MLPAGVLLCGYGCVALLYAFLYIQQNNCLHK